ncbi:hypothetical protein CSW60_00005, partial [Caulobacter sp. X]
MDSQASDNALAERAAAGDDQAFAVLVRRHKERLYRLLRHRRARSGRDPSHRRAEDQGPGTGGRQHPLFPAPDHRPA